MKRIYYAAYNEAFISMVEKTFNEIGKEIGILVYDKNNPNELIDLGAMVVIARGGTAKRIKSF